MKTATVVVVTDNRVVEFNTCSEEDAIGLFLDKIEEFLDLDDAEDADIEGFIQEGFVTVENVGINICWHEE